MAVELSKRTAQTIVISDLFPRCDNMDQMSEDTATQKNKIPANAVKDPVTRDFINRKRNFRKTAIEDANDLLEEQKRATGQIEGKIQTQEISSKFIDLEALKKAGDEETYNTVRNELNEEVQDFYGKHQAKLHPVLKEKIGTMAASHKMNVRPPGQGISPELTEKMTAEYEKAKAETGSHGILRIIKKLAPRWGKIVEARHEERKQAPSTPRFKSPVEDR